MCQETEKLTQKIQELKKLISCNVFNQTRFTSIILTANDTLGVPLGQGKCKAVRLRANFYQLEQTLAQCSVNVGYIYYGDKNQQSYEYLLNLYDGNGGGSIYQNPNDSALIYCKDLQDIWVKLPTINSVSFIELQIMIFDNDFDD